MSKLKVTAQSFGVVAKETMPVTRVSRYGMKVVWSGWSCLVTRFRDVPVYHIQWRAALGLKWAFLKVMLTPDEGSLVPEQ